MKETQPQSGAITLVISEVIEPSQVADYEAWTQGINQDAKRFDGFLGVEVIRPRDHAHPEYVVIVKFDTYEHLRTWLMSPTYQAWMDRSDGLIASRSQQQLPSGLELWFTLPKVHPRRRSSPPSPPYYKKVILGVLAVYPLIVLADALLGPLLTGFPPLLALLVSVIFVSALLTYPVMPWLSRGLGFWLYPKADRR
jgi:antibiotic biosynthesis monooxygenase (ABM) superfamily enzyme